ncbi:MAG: bifunctional pyr operon transcriptional regulator/uracil phosphoribosyltransferase PyrR [Spirochaetes bacterium]|nr:bifunctional pyr operon transcriptional regulator/uracil phosphoribosyltransferase PyrR [Spirochaetota bacterium]
MASEIILDKARIEALLEELSERIFRDTADFSNFAIVGVQTRGVELARRLRNRIEAKGGAPVKHGVLDITFHRDDLATRGVLPIIKETRIEFDITNMTILLVDDVIFTGRTTKAALETIMTFGRPKAIRLFVLIDRGNRELPIQPDYCGHIVKTSIEDSVDVKLLEIDGVDDSVIMRQGQA